MIDSSSGVDSSWYLYVQHFGKSYLRKLLGSVSESVFFSYRPSLLYPSIFSNVARSPLESSLLDHPLAVSLPSQSHIPLSLKADSCLGVCLPIMLNNLIASHGFRKAVQYTAALITGLLCIALALMHPRLPGNKKGAPKPSPKEIFQSNPYKLLVAGLFCVAWGLFFPIYYLQVSLPLDTKRVFWS